MEKKNSEEKEEDVIQRAYVYLVKIPVSNDQMICASESIFYPETYVVVPTRFGLDMAVVVGSADNIDGSSYERGCTGILGACHMCPCIKGSVSDDDSDGDIVACGDIEGTDIIYDDRYTKQTLGKLPEFEFVNSPDIGIPDYYNECDEEWDSIYRKPEIVVIDGDIPWISHMATPEEIARFQKNTQEELVAARLCKEKIVSNKLDMKLVAAHFMLCEQKVLFFFTSEDRVDFRALVKDLVQVFRMRIELRQIGVRDEARVLGGLAACGRDFCCHSVSDKLKPVTIKMAKEQNLSLNSMKISGPCGRLLCCLSYEYDFYNEEKKNYPDEGSRIKIKGELYRITEVNILARSVTVQASEGSAVTIPRSAIVFSGKNDRWEILPEFEEQLFD